MHVDAVRWAIRLWANPHYREAAGERPSDAELSDAEKRVLDLIGDFYADSERELHWISLYQFILDKTDIVAGGIPDVYCRFLRELGNPKLSPGRGTRQTRALKAVGLGDQTPKKADFQRLFYEIAVALEGLHDPGELRRRVHDLVPGRWPTCADIDLSDRRWFQRSAMTSNEVPHFWVRPEATEFSQKMADAMLGEQPSDKIVLLLGEPDSGKTRIALEYLRDHLADHRFLALITARSLRALADGIRALGPRQPPTVVLVEDLHNALDADVDIERSLHDIAGIRNVLVVATAHPERIPVDGSSRREEMYELAEHGLSPAVLERLHANSVDVRSSIHREELDGTPLAALFRSRDEEEVQLGRALAGTDRLLQHWDAAASDPSLAPQAALLWAMLEAHRIEPDGSIREEDLIERARLFAPEVGHARLRSALEWIEAPDPSEPHSFSSGSGKSYRLVDGLAREMVFAGSFLAPKDYSAAQIIRLIERAPRYVRFVAGEDIFLPMLRSLDPTEMSAKEVVAAARVALAADDELSGEAERFLSSIVGSDPDVVSEGASVAFRGRLHREGQRLLSLLTDAAPETLVRAASTAFFADLRDEGQRLLALINGAAPDTLAEAASIALQEGADVEGQRLLALITCGAPEVLTRAASTAFDASSRHEGQRLLALVLEADAEHLIEGASVGLAAGLRDEAVRLLSLVMVAEPWVLAQAASVALEAGLRDEGQRLLALVTAADPDTLVRAARTALASGLRDEGQRLLRSIGPCEEDWLMSYARAAELAGRYGLLGEMEMLVGLVDQSSADELFESFSISARSGHVSLAKELLKSILAQADGEPIQYLTASSVALRLGLTEDSAELLCRSRPESVVLLVFKIDHAIALGLHDIVETTLDELEEAFTVYGRDGEENNDDELVSAAGFALGFGRGQAAERFLGVVTAEEEGVRQRASRLAYNAGMHTQVERLRKTGISGESDTQH